MEPETAGNSWGQWGKKKRTKMLKLPSGAIIEVQENKIHPMLIGNFMPMSLLNMAMGPGENGSTPDNIGEDTVEVVRGMKKIFELVRHVVVRPKIISEGVPKDGEVLEIDIPHEDLEFLMGYVLRSKEAEALEPFHPGQPSTVARPPLQTVRTEAVNGHGPEERQGSGVPVRSGGDGGGDKGRVGPDEGSGETV